MTLKTIHTQLKYPTVLLICLLFSTCRTGKTLPKSTPEATTPVFKNIQIARGDRDSPYGPCEPTICINPLNKNNIAAGAILDRYYWSVDGGLNWFSSRLICPYGVYGDPVIVADYKGNFYYAHLSDPENQGWASPSLLDRIVIQKSSSSGQIYDPGTYCGLNPPKDQDKHWLAVDSLSGNLYCSWTEFDKYGSKNTTADRSRIRFSRSTDEAHNWSTPVTISELDGDCADDDNTPEGAVPAIGPNGEIYIVWSNQNKIWLDRSLDGGQTWLEHDVAVADQPGGWAFEIPGLSRCNGMPSLVCDRSPGPKRGTLYVNWSDQRNGSNDTDVWVAESTDGGNTWSKPVRVNDDKKGSHQFFNWMEIDQSNGNLYVVFYDRRAYTDNQTDVYLGVSEDGGKSFQNLKISESPFDPESYVFFGDYNHIAVQDGRVRPIWTRLDNGVLSVWTAIIDMNNK
ncbi:MAG: exo-alpha-sialidase [Lewinellaceae bacterium]|nr:exo-alpha-sialidase [Lewinellaceae bacterium]